ncbi:MAG TPA: serine/threonine-protein kinase [Ktedonobacterales bacterium]|jgi:serine/threonine protein kinase
MTHLDGQRMGNYRLVRLLGQGGFAQVYLGEHLYVPRRQAAIKVLSERYSDVELERFCNEVSTIFHLVHPLIVRVLDFGVEGRTPFLVMDYASNGTLRQRHVEGTQAPLEAILRYVKQVAEALQYAHEARVIHRDIKPENLLVGDSQQILLSDFGIAVRSHRSVSRTPQRISGTARYMAPEQCEGRACQESDQYSLAVVVYEWLSGEPPFPGDDPFSVALQHIQAPPPPLRDRVPTLAPEVERAVLRALEKNPHARFPSVQAFAAALEEAILPPRLPAAVPALAEPPPPDTPPPAPRPLTQPPAQLPPHPRPRREGSILGKGSLRYFMGGALVMLIGIVALAQGDPLVGGFALLIGCIICIGAFLVS